MTTAVLIECNRAILATRYAELMFATRLKIVATMLGSKPEKHSIMLLGMALRIATALNMQHAISCIVSPQHTIGVLASTSLATTLPQRLHL